jgi:glycosyltransferase involved in cell wall biosynthesis
MGTLDAQTRALIERDYGDLLRMGRVEVRDSFTPDEEYIALLAQHRFGLSFYMLDRARSGFFAPGSSIHPWSLTNYWTGFPGKIGMYMSAGVPVISSDLPGTAFVRDHGVGVLIADPTPDSIRAAAREIAQDYERYVANCLRLAQRYCFRKNVAGFMASLDPGGSS